MLSQNAAGRFNFDVDAAGTINNLKIPAVSLDANNSAYAPSTEDAASTAVTVKATDAVVKATGAVVTLIADAAKFFNEAAILKSLRDSDSLADQTLFQLADACRQHNVGEVVCLRGLIEFSNLCQRNCWYCGLRRSRQALSRYSMTQDEILAAAAAAAACGYDSVVLQSGENLDLEISWLVELVSRLRQKLKLAITLSLGERSIADLAQLRQAGADRYLLRFETSNVKLFQQIHPDAPFAENSASGSAAEAFSANASLLPPSAGHPRLGLLRRIKQLGYEVGSGIMVGIPGQTYADLIADLRLFQELQLDMVGIGPYLAHPDTPLAKVQPLANSAATPQQTPASELLVRKMLAWTRLLLPHANLPATTALGTINPENGREHGLQCGANVLMPNCTPLKYRRLYEIYPDKICLREADNNDFCQQSLKQRVLALGRKLPPQ